MSKIKELGLLFVQTATIVFITVSAVIPLSCKITTEGIEIIGGDYKTPVIEGVEVVNDRQVCIQFSDYVKIRNMVVSKVIPGISDSDEHSSTIDLSPALAAACGQFGKIQADVQCSEDNKSINILMEQSTEIGKSYEVFGTVLDKIGNSLTFCIPFAGFNSSIPKILMTEVQIKYAKGTLDKKTVYRGEYVELLAFEDGNLSGLELLSAADGEGKKYVFPPVEVKKGEIVLVHLRTIGEGCVNEIEDNLDAATAPFSVNGVRDLWSEDTVAHFNDSSDIIYLRNTVTNEIVDALMYAVENTTEWKPSVEETAGIVGNSGIYSSADISNASNSKGCSPLKSLTRVDSQILYQQIMNDDEIEYPVVSNENAWMVTAGSPGVL